MSIMNKITATISGVLFFFLFIVPSAGICDAKKAKEIILKAINE